MPGDRQRTDARARSPERGSGELRSSKGLADRARLTQVRGVPRSLRDSLAPLRLAGSAPPPSKEPREESKSSSRSRSGGDVEERDRGGNRTTTRDQCHLSPSPPIASSVSALQARHLPRPKSRGRKASPSLPHAVGEMSRNETEGAIEQEPTPDVSHPRAPFGVWYRIGRNLTRINTDLQEVASRTVDGEKP